MKETLKIENAKILYKNFSGRETAVNRKGSRNFFVRIDGRKANKLKKQGWNIKCTDFKVKTKGNISKNKKVWFLPVSIKENIYDIEKEPKIYMQIKGNKDSIVVDETTIKLLDYADISYAYIEIYPYKWKSPNGTSGTKAYLKTGLFSLNPYVNARKILSLIKLEDLYS